MQVLLDYNSLSSYSLFLKIKALPTFKIRGRMAEFPDEYISRLGLDVPQQQQPFTYRPPDVRGVVTIDNQPFRLFDYQQAFSSISIRKKKFGCFVAPGYGKTAIAAECAAHALSVLPATGRRSRVLIVSPPMLLRQTRDELHRFYGGTLTPTIIPAAKLQAWLDGDDNLGHPAGSTEARFGITNYEALKKGIQQGQLGALLLDEADIIASAYGTFGRRIIRIGRGLEYKWLFTGTPAPNDHTEFAPYAVFLDQEPNINSFLANYFVNRGETSNRWEIMPFAKDRFYRDISHWCVFMENPATYGFKDNADTIPPIHVHIDEVELTPEQRDAVRRATGKIVPTNPGGITGRGVMSRIAKGTWRGKEIPTLKYDYIRDLINGWRSKESTLVWAWFDDEQNRLERALPDSASMRGKTKMERRLEMIDDFKAGRVREIISKPQILGSGQNLQVATRQVFSSIIDSWRKWHQCVKRSNRVGSTLDLHVHVPLTEIEMPMFETVIAKAKRIEEMMSEQEKNFKEQSWLAGSW